MIVIISKTTICTYYTHIQLTFLLFKYIYIHIYIYIYTCMFMSMYSFLSVILD